MTLREYVDSGAGDNLNTYSIIAYLLAAVFFVLAALQVRTRPGWPLWLPLGLLAWVSVPLVYAIQAR